MPSREAYYCTTFSQTFSPCGKFLATGDCYGRVTIFSVASALASGTSTLEPSSQSQNYKYLQFIADPGCSLYGLATSDSHLFCGGGDGCIRAYSWSSLEKKITTPAFCLNSVSTNVDSLRSSKSPEEINALVISKNNESLFGAGGSAKINEFSLETGKVKRSLAGHSDYIHCLCLVDENALVSGAEDGLVKLWDLRVGGAAVQTFAPFQSEVLARPKLGKWIGCVVADENWIVCGGGVELGLWNWKSRTLARAMPSSSPSVTHYAALFHEDKIFTGGSAPFVCHWNFMGECEKQVPTASRRIFDIKINASPKYKIMTACGDSSVDVFINFGYSAFTMAL